MSDAAATVEVGAEAAPPKSKKMLIIIIVAVVLLAAGGGGGFWYWKKKQAEEAEAAAAKDKKGAKGKAAHAEEEHGDAHGDEEEEEEEDAHSDEHAAEAPPAKSTSRAAVFRMPDDSKVKEVIELQPFVINLADTADVRYLRMTASVGIGGDEEGGGEHKADPLLTTRVRNAMLAVLTTRTSEEILTVEGKAKLRADLLRASRRAAKEAHIEAIYITEFIVQM